MAESNQDQNCAGSCEQRGPSITLLVFGILALALSAWTLSGAPSWLSDSPVPLGWIAIGGAIVIGLLLVLTPRRSR